MNKRNYIICEILGFDDQRILYFFEPQKQKS